jgi:hypothetical protein
MLRIETVNREYLSHRRQFSGAGTTLKLVVQRTRQIVWMHRTMSSVAASNSGLLLFMDDAVQIVLNQILI